MSGWGDGPWGGMPWGSGARPELVVVSHGGMGYGVNKQDPPYLRDTVRGQRRSEIRKLHGEREIR
jgi:hypothetical protein